MIILDTNVVSEIMKPQPSLHVMHWLRSQRLDDLALTAITAAEIEYGIGRLPAGRRRSGLQRDFTGFLDQGFAARVFAFDGSAASRYADIMISRERGGRPIDPFDAMIAAIALDRGTEIATRDLTGFAGCGVKLLDPFSLHRR